ncbi:MAG: CsbD family protein [Rhodoferax sp.]
MNKDQAKGTVKNLTGKVQEEAGKLVGSNEQRVKGLNKQIEGKAQKTFGDVKEVVKDAIDKT